MCRWIWALGCLPTISPLVSLPTNGSRRYARFPSSGHAAAYNPHPPYYFSRRTDRDATRAFRHLGDGLPPRWLPRRPKWPPSSCEK
eukprot:4260359-Pyramimonas_sp.AAC.1